MSSAKKSLTVEEKYRLYEDSVQNPSNDISIINKEFQRYFKRKPVSIREDFCGTGYLSCTWVKQSPKHLAHGIDLDSEPIAYGQKTHFKKLKPDQQKRMHYHKDNVLGQFSFKTDVIAALNFSYFIFKERDQLIRYFKQVHKGLAKTGAFIMDLFGGTATTYTNVEANKHDTFTYYWDCAKFNPINNECLYHIHYKSKGKKHLNVFTYDWRMWTPREIQECLKEAGFKESHVYWEGFDTDGSGDGKFKPTKEEENSLGWVAFIMAIKK